MMAHVAEASESSGRVLFWTDCGTPFNPAAAHAAARLAAAFNAEIETLAVAHGNMPGRDGVPATSVATRPAHDNDGASTLERAVAAGALVARRHRREIATMASRFGVNCRHADATGDAIDVLAELCLVRGPWNVVVTGGPSGISSVGTLFANVSGATGIVVAPRATRYPDGPVAVVAEDLERLAPMLRAARRLTRMFGRIHVIAAAQTRDCLRDLEDQARLAAASDPDLVIEVSQPCFGADGVYDQRLRELKASFIVSRFGGTLLPTARVLARTIELAGAPFLLVR